MAAVTIDLTGVDMRRVGVHGWTLKKDAAAVLAKLRERGWNVDKCVDLHPAQTTLFRFWVIGRPDPLAEFTWLMASDGTWARGRLWDGYFSPATWQPMPTAERIPATFTHVTRTVPDSANRRERYKTKSNGSQGRWVRSDDSIALCTCPWKAYHQTRAEAQAAARYHRATKEEPCRER